MITRLARAGLLAGIALLGPAAVVSVLVAAEPGQPPLPAAAGAVSTALQRERGADPAGEPALDVPMVAGVLYTSGRADIDWNGMQFEVTNGTYAFLGSETVRLAPDAMGILRLDGGGTLFLCPGSSSRMTSGADGFAHEVFEGTTRVMLPGGTPFRIVANGHELRPHPEPGAGLAGPYVVEVTAQGSDGMLAVGLRRALDLTYAGGAERVAAGEIVERAADSGPGLARVPIPADLFANLSVGLQGGEAGGVGSGSDYLCRSRELQRFAEQAAAPALEAPADGTAEGAEAAEAAVPAPPVAPPAELPELPAVAIAEPGAPIPFDPNLLPPPAAGPGGGSAPTVVAAPAAPAPVVAGGGGAEAVVSPS